MVMARHRGVCPSAGVPRDRFGNLRLRAAGHKTRLHSGRFEVQE